ncbi:helix-turn-helix domain-containing protein [Streptomyces jumonjinensis]|uniref:Helix-turn-helix domain-containing protein n=1 Tax=Streptomyces jumonjinensis TaxID=1945 RepID=A0A646KG60_STRJU|nr:helix-turn-helix transcriptional regulator [Streptomyces jumonjinensis]MQT01108.1 helix-turn-helix domain-containing protein [Streptomyces jumonjinensis]
MAKGQQQAAWEFFGTELRRRREEAKLTQAEVGAAVFVSGGYIGQFETAIRKPQLDVAQRLDALLQTGGFFERLWRKLIDSSAYASYFRAAAELEALATYIYDFEPALVPGLMQTATYARAVTLADNPFAEEERIENTITGRMERARLLKGPANPKYWAILHEQVLRVQVGGPEAMAKQLDHLADLIRSRRAVVQVIPFSAGAHTLMGKTFTLMEFDDTPPTVYTEAVYSGNLLDDPAVVKRAQRAYDLLRAAALSPEASLTLIESVAEDHRRCASTT